MYCTNCGKEVREGAKFCNHCGAELKKPILEEQQVPPEKPKEKKSKLIPIVAALCVCLLAGGGALYFSSRDKAPEPTGSESAEASAVPESQGEDASFNGHVYHVYDVDEVNNWDDAKLFCEKQGGHLATITSQEENDFLYNYINECGIQTAYFGLSDAKKEGEWEWVTGEKVSYTNWYPKEPNNADDGENEAGFYFKSDSNGRWFDGRMGTSNGGKAFICEWDNETKEPTPTMAPAPEATKAPTDLSFDDISKLIQEAADLYCGVFLWQDTVDRDDMIDQDNGYYRVVEANSKEELYQLCLKHYTKDRTDWMFADHEWIEQNGKLYVSRSMGLGGPVTEEADVSFHRDSETQYTVHFVGYSTGASGLMRMGEYDMLLDYVDGYWVWEDVFDNADMELRQA